MGWGLVHARRAHQDTTMIHRFDPRFWTVNFARPMMASVVATADDALRVDAAFYRSDDLAGLIWEAEDRWDHPLLAYATDRDFSRVQWRFRWRSAGVIPLDAVNGPTLTIEGRDAAGASRSWYVRLWNYAIGTPEDAEIAIDFGDLHSGFVLPGEGELVFPRAIDRMVISLVPPEYGGSAGAPLAVPREGWAELSAMRVSGSGAVIAIGDVWMPEHGVGIASGYDDQYHLTPQRVVRMAEQLGYRGDILHYVGMSHYPKLAMTGGRLLATAAGGAMNAPCAAWHEGFAAAAAAAGLGIIWSLSFELFDALCPDEWKQRDHLGDPALTGWIPPSTLLSPANTTAMAYLQAVATAFVTTGRSAGLAAKFQVGEPWWWVNSGGRLCASDSATVAALGSDYVVIDDVRGQPSVARAAMLDALGAILASATAALVAAARDAAGPSGMTSHLLVFLPSLIDPAAPGLVRCNVPLGWASPAYDVLQIEDYDWVTSGRSGETEPASAAVTARLGYALTDQHYLAGFVRDVADRAQWAAIADAVRAAKVRGVARRFIWALPQIARDGFILTPVTEEADVHAFDDLDFPLSIGREAMVMTEFSTQVIAAPSGHEQRVSEWADARMRYDAGPGVRSETELRTLAAFFRARRGAARGFRFRDPLDASSANDGGVPAAGDQLIGTGDGVRREFALVKRYGDGDAVQVRRIIWPVASSVVAAVNGSDVAEIEILPGGQILLPTAPPIGAAVTAGFIFDVPVRFAEDRLDISRATFLAGEAAHVPLVEVRS